MQHHRLMSTSPSGEGRELIDACAIESVRLLERNTNRYGVLAASVTPEAEARSYTRIFGRDAAICVLAMLESESKLLQEGAVASLDALAQLQAPNGQIPKYVDPEGQDADFWYLGCIDATLWWLLAVNRARRCSFMPGLATRWRRQEERALNWLVCQEHQRFFLLQQNEASDWADIMPRSGFVLYTNALWHRVKQLYDMPDLDETRYHFNHLFHPYSRDLPEYRRARLLQHYVRQRAPRHDMYLSFVNLSFFGDEGDVFGNLLAILCGLAPDSMAHQIVKTIDAAHAADPYPVRVTCEPITPEHELWRTYMARHQQNFEFQYHNGGIWPFVGGFWVMALAQLGKNGRAWRELEKLAHVNRLDNWRFTEWFHGESLEPMGMAGQSWNAATYLMALRALEGVGSQF
jgi:hypothetical protein